ncbi:hypothetical protein C8R47DRAFT_1192551 [Mycena vitilis]|nr:hypothetical protein C8R47DRAFT_1192551 [Mycena vitilis]
MRRASLQPEAVSQSGTDEDLVSSDTASSLSKKKSSKSPFKAIFGSKRSDKVKTELPVKEKSSAPHGSPQTIGQPRPILSRAAQTWKKLGARVFGSHSKGLSAVQRSDTGKTLFNDSEEPSATDEKKSNAEPTPEVVSHNLKVTVASKLKLKLKLAASKVSITKRFKRVMNAVIRRANLRSNLWGAVAYWIIQSKVHVPLGAFVLEWIENLRAVVSGFRRGSSRGSSGNWLVLSFLLLNVPAALSIWL